MSIVRRLSFAKRPSCHRACCDTLWHRLDYEHVEEVEVPGVQHVIPLHEAPARCTRSAHVLTRTWPTVDRRKSVNSGAARRGATTLCLAKRVTTRNEEIEFVTCLAPEIMGVRSSSAIRRPSFVRINTKRLFCITRSPSSLTIEQIDKQMLV